MWHYPSPGRPRARTHTALCCDFALDPDIFHSAAVVVGPRYPGATDRAASCDKVPWICPKFADDFAAKSADNAP